MISYPSARKKKIQYILKSPFFTSCPLKITWEVKEELGYQTGSLIRRLIKVGRGCSKAGNRGSWMLRWSGAIHNTRKRKLDRYQRRAPVMTLITGTETMHSASRCDR